jgi:hypothetical protein
MPPEPESPSATETAMDSIGQGTPAPAPEQSAAPAAPQADKAPAPAPEVHQEGEPRHSDKFTELLDSMSAPDPNGPPDKPEKPDTPEAKPAEAAAPGQPAKAPAPAAPVNEEAELLEGVRSDRGKERIRQMFQEKKALEQDVGEFRQLVNNTGMTPEQFAQTLEFGRLVNTGDEKNIRVAIEMIEAQRTELYKRLGAEAPGVDLLADQADLRQAVDDMEITRERALELARLRRQNAQQLQSQQATQQAQESQQKYAQTVQQAAATMDAYLNSRAGEADHSLRIKALTDHFNNPANMQNFVTKYAPELWLDTVRLLYDNVAVPRTAPRPGGQQPIHSRPSVLGQATINGESPMERMARRLDSMGI